MGRYIEVEPQVNLYVEDLGPKSSAGQSQGIPVIFLHGWPVNHLMFESLFAKLPAQGFRCIGIDQRGFGKSDAPWEGYTYDRAADDLRAVIDALELRNAILVGFSMGGAVAARYMSRHAGHQIGKLLLIGAAAPAFTKREGFDYGLKKAKVDELIALAYADRPKMNEVFGKGFTKSKPSDAFSQWMTALGMQASAHGTIKAAEMLRDEDVIADLPKIQVPTTIFHGAKDEVCPYELAELQQQAIPDATIVKFEKSGHGINVDEPERFEEELGKFLSGSTASKSADAVQVQPS